MKKLVISILVIIFIFACSGGNSENGNISNLSRPNISSGIDLRLGQLSNSSSPVAVSAALQNGESITIFAENAADDFDAIYVAPNSQTIQVRLDPTGRPSLVRFQNTTLAYTNYTKENTVDITIQTPDTSRRARTITLRNQPITQGVLDYLNGDEFLRIILQIDPDADSETRALLAAIVGALRFIGCGVEQLENELESFIPRDFIPELCSTDLPKEIEQILGFANYQAILVNLTDNKPECDNPSGYDQYSACALAIWEDLVEASKLGSTGNYPKSGNDTGSSTGGNTGSNTGGTNTGKPGDKPTSTPTYTPTFTNTPTPTNTPTFTPTNTPSSGSSGLIGSWIGGGGGSGGSTCPGATFQVSFMISSNGDASCSMANPCIISGNFTGDPGFPIQNAMLTGSIFVNPNGTTNATFVATQFSPPDSLNGTGSGINETTINGGFNSGGCNGTFAFMKL